MNFCRKLMPPNRLKMKRGEPTDDLCKTKKLNKFYNTLYIYVLECKSNLPFKLLNVKNLMVLDCILSKVNKS